MKLTVEEEKKIEEGKHEGVIVELQERTKPFNYTDLVVEFNGTKLKYGVPTKLTMNSQLGKLMLDFGASLQVGKELNLNETFVGKQVEFMVMNNKTDRGTFANIVKGSLKPLVKQEAVE